MLGEDLQSCQNSRLVNIAIAGEKSGIIGRSLTCVRLMCFVCEAINKKARK